MYDAIIYTQRTAYGKVLPRFVALLVAFVHVRA